MILGNFLLSLQRVTEVNAAKDTKNRGGSQGKHEVKTVRNQSKRTMEAIKLSIGFREWSKLPDFVETINQEDEMVAYQIDNTTAIIVTQGCCGTAWVKAQAELWFEDQYTETIKK